MKKSIKKINTPTVTVGISALNEEKNIKALLQSILTQAEAGFKLEKILLISDGSTDNTVKIAYSIKSLKIEIKAHKNRLGLSARLNEIFSSLTSDILIITDADVLWGNQYIIRDITKAFLKDNRVMMACGHAKPLKPKSFTEKAVFCTYQGYAPLKEKLKNSNNILSVHGCITAFRKEYIKNIRIPLNIIGTDLFTYLDCVMKGYSYRYVKSALVYFRLPQTIKDQVKQNTRQVEARKRLKKYFSQSVIDNEMEIPKFFLLYSLGKQFIKHPILCAYIFIINQYSRRKAYSDGSKQNGKWQMVNSTKDLNS